MTSCDALFFYQLLVPICDPSCSGIADNPHVSFYETVSNNTNIYAYGYKSRGGTRGHQFSSSTAREILVWDGIVAQNLSNNIHNCWMINQTNTYDQNVAKAMHCCCWVDIKSCMKQNKYFRETKRGDHNYDPMQKYQLIWDVMCHNMNQI
jgi:hypothetical protein